MPWEPAEAAVGFAPKRQFNLMKAPWWWPAHATGRPSPSPAHPERASPSRRGIRLPIGLRAVGFGVQQIRTERPGHWILLETEAWLATSQPLTLK